AHDAVEKPAWPWGIFTTWKVGLAGRRPKHWRSSGPITRSRVVPRAVEQFNPLAAPEVGEAAELAARLRRGPGRQKPAAATEPDWSRRVFAGERAGRRQHRCASPSKPRSSV